MDSPTTSTGFGTVSRNLLKALDATGKYRFTVLGISHLGLPFDVSKYPYLEFPKHGGLFSAQEGNDIYGMSKCLRMLGSGDYDILFILNDPFIMQFVLPQIVALRKDMKKHFKIVFYFPTDCLPKKEWANTAALADFPVAYTMYGALSMKLLNKSLDGRLGFLYHGTDKETFKPMVGKAREAMRRMIFGQNAEKFIILNVNRNQPRKDLNSTFDVFARLKARTKKPVFLYILASMNDMGGNLEEIAQQHGLVLGQDWECPNPKMFSPNQGLPIENVAQLYGTSDLLMTTTLGEGWGLSITEAQASKLPVVAPRHSSLVEIIGDNEERGWLVSTGGPGHTVCMGPNDNNVVRPVVHHEEMVDRIRKIIDYPSQSAKKVQAAFDWVPTWDEVGAEWVKIFARASLPDTVEVKNIEEPLVEAMEEVTTAP
jgi:glycosyltransferase involved in cell wall biosynthesis